MKLSLALPLLIGIPLLGITQTDESDFAFTRMITPHQSVEGLGVVELDRHLFEFTGADQSDLRLIKTTESGSLDWPFIVAKKATGLPRRTAQSIPSEITRFMENPDGSITVEVASKAEQPSIASIEIETPLKNFEKRVDIEGSVDALNWRPLLKDQLIFDREQFIDFRATRIRLPENDCLHFRLIVREATDDQVSAVRQVTASQRNTSERTTVTTRKFRVDRIRLFSASQDPVKGDDSKTYQVAIRSSDFDIEKKATHLYLDTHRCPLNRLSLITRDRNFNREYRVQIQRGGHSGSWQNISSGRVYRYDIAGFEEERLSLSFPETRAEPLRLVFENGDNQPLSIDGFNAQGPAYNLEFLHDAPEASWCIRYGARTGEYAKPQYDVLPIHQAKKAGVDRIEFTVSDPAANSSFETEGQRNQLTDLLLSPWTLRTVIAIVVLVLVGIIVRTSRQFEEADQDPHQKGAEP